ncbi:MAG TPA: hypothetical protein VGG27_07045 [Magnetospirillaceae bacterium]|jgi:hypothetical protein
MDADRLFLERCKQLQTFVSAEEVAEINFLDAAAALRQLFLDDHPLINTVNIKSRMKINYEVGKSWFGPDPYAHLVTFQSDEDSVDPHNPPPSRPFDTLSRDQFMARVVMTINDQQKSIHDLIGYAANVAGGVHHDTKPDPKYHAQHDAAQYLAIGGLPAGIRMLRAITKVALRGLGPLIDDVKSRLSA